MGMCITIYAAPQATRACIDAEAPKYPGTKFLAHPQREKRDWAIYFVPHSPLHPRMAKQGWHRFAMPIGPSFGMFKVELHLEATDTERDDPLTSAFVEDMLHLSLKSTKELVSHLIVVDKLLAYSPKADVIMIYGPVR